LAGPGPVPLPLHDARPIWRDRPIDQQQQADLKHKQFDDEKSEFMGTLKLWKWLDDVRGGPGHSAEGQPERHKLSHRKFDALLRDDRKSTRLHSSHVKNSYA